MESTKPEPRQNDSSTCRTNRTALIQNSPLAFSVNSGQNILPQCSSTEIVNKEIPVEIEENAICSAMGILGSGEHGECRADVNSTTGESKANEMSVEAGPQNANNQIERPMTPLSACTAHCDSDQKATANTGHDSDVDQIQCKDIFLDAVKPSKWMKELHSEVPVVLMNVQEKVQDRDIARIHPEKIPVCVADKNHNTLPEELRFAGSDGQSVTPVKQTCLSKVQQEDGLHGDLLVAQIGEELLEHRHMSTDKITELVVEVSVDSSPEEPVQPAPEKSRELALNEVVVMSPEEPLPSTLDGPVESSQKEPVTGAADELPEISPKEPVDSTPEKPMDIASQPGKPGPEELVESLPEEPVMTDPEEPTEPVEFPKEYVQPAPAKTVELVAPEKQAQIAPNEPLESAQETNMKTAAKPALENPMETASKPLEHGPEEPVKTNPVQFAEASPVEPAKLFPKEHVNSAPVKTVKFAAPEEHSEIAPAEPLEFAQGKIIEPALKPAQSPEKPVEASSEKRIRLFSDEHATTALEAHVEETPAAKSLTFALEGSEEHSPEKPVEQSPEVPVTLVETAPNQRAEFDPEEPVELAPDQPREFASKESTEPSPETAPKEHVETAQSKYVISCSPDAKSTPPDETIEYAPDESLELTQEFAEPYQREPIAFASEETVDFGPQVSTESILEGHGVHTTEDTAVSAQEEHVQFTPAEPIDVMLYGKDVCESVVPCSRLEGENPEGIHSPNNTDIELDDLFASPTKLLPPMGALHEREVTITSEETQCHQDTDSKKETEKDTSMFSDEDELTSFTSPEVDFSCLDSDAEDRGKRGAESSCTVMKDSLPSMPSVMQAEQLNIDQACGSSSSNSHNMNMGSEAPGLQASVNAHIDLQEVARMAAMSVALGAKNDNQSQKPLKRKSEEKMSPKQKKKKLSARSPRLLLSTPSQENVRLNIFPSGKKSQQPSVSAGYDSSEELPDLGIRTGVDRDKSEVCEGTRSGRTQVEFRPSGSKKTASKSLPSGLFPPQKSGSPQIKKTTITSRRRSESPVCISLLTEDEDSDGNPTVTVTPPPMIALAPVCKQEPESNSDEEIPTHPRGRSLKRKAHHLRSGNSSLDYGDSGHAGDDVGTPGSGSTRHRVKSSTPPCDAATSSPASQRSQRKSVLISLLLHS